MKVVRVLNNNVVLGEEDGTLYLAMGLSIGFKRKNGSTLPSSEIEKMFVLKSPKYVNRLQKMIDFIPDEYFTFCTDVVIYIKKELKKEISDSLYVILTDHIHASVERYRNGIVLKNALLNEVRKFYSDEFRIASHIVDMINETFKVNLGDDEAAFIAFNIVNAQNEGNTSNVLEMTRLIQEILLLVKNKYNIEYNDDDASYTRFVTHLKYFCQKVFRNKADTFNDADMVQLVKNKYSKEYEGALDIMNLVKSKYAYQESEMDAVYLAIHIARVLNG